ncbi:hypothetical protein QYE76_018446 [Lolium multiflorum]|uniref:t-SNARE coiled-coil homology domain-containing protein n=1 Tax=Lolium multiflorum TaxID=4521 RepID=A0AAD8UZ07_LOLMU|nr:hypothetical protein QYE76_018446 [Lolium multiflorum]
MNDLMTKSFMSYVDLKKAAMKDLEAGDRTELTEAGGACDERLKGFFVEVEVVKEGDVRHPATRSPRLRGQRGGQVAAPAQAPARPRGASRRHRGRAPPRPRDPASGSRSPGPRQRRAARALRRLRRGHHPRPHPHLRHRRARKLKDIMLDFQALRQQVMAEQGHRRAPLLRSPGRCPRTRSSSIISEGKGEEIMGAADRHDAAREVERSLLELHQVFLDMAVVVESQGEKLDDIVTHVDNAKDYVHTGNKELGKAREHQRGSRKCLYIGIILLLLLILIVIVPIATSLKRS